MAVVPPRPAPWMSDADRQRLRDLPALIAAARAALSRELGAEPRLVERDPGSGPRWLLGPARAQPGLAELAGGPCPRPTLILDRRRQLLVSDAPDLAGVYETFGQLRALCRLQDGRHEVADCSGTEDMIARVREEVADTWPGFGLKGLTWSSLCERHAPRVRAAADPVDAVRRWLAELGDAHTGLRRSEIPWRLPYEVHAGPDRAVLAQVPEGSAGHRAGARAGMALLDEALEPIWAVTGASPHQRPWLAGRRLLEGPPGQRALAVRGPGGRRLAWTEPRRDPLAGPLVSLQRLPSGHALLRIALWWPSAEAALDAAMERAMGAPGLIVDLRGNGGGNLPMAARFRDRFLRARTRLGTLRYTVPGGGLGPEEPLWGEPAPAHLRYPGPVRFLTDPLTYSASEDCLLGLQGLPHVRVLGQPSGGGSGRMRMLRFAPGWRLAISTALTWDRQRRCVEGRGIAVDQVIPRANGRSTAGDPCLPAAVRSL